MPGPLISWCAQTTVGRVCLEGLLAMLLLHANELDSCDMTRAAAPELDVSEFDAADAVRATASVFSARSVC